MEWAPAYHLQSFLPDDAPDIPSPEVPDWLVWIWRCWNRLNPDRPWHGGGLGAMIPGSIPWQAVAAYGEFYDYDDGQMHMLDHCVRAMDAVFIAHYQKKAGSKST